MTYVAAADAAVVAVTTVGSVVGAGADGERDRVNSWPVIGYYVVVVVGENCGRCRRRRRWSGASRQVGRVGHGEFRERRSGPRRRAKALTWSG